MNRCRGAEVYGKKTAAVEKWLRIATTMSGGIVDSEAVAADDKPGASFIRQNISVRR